MENILSAWQGFCPGLTHGQKFGITYVASEDRQDIIPTNDREPTIARSHSAKVVPGQSSDDSPSQNKNSNDDFKELDEKGPENDSPQE